MMWDESMKHCSLDIICSILRGALYRQSLEEEPR
jgi:hypothetical protein